MVSRNLYRLLMSTRFIADYLNEPSLQI